MYFDIKSGDYLAHSKKSSVQLTSYDCFLKSQNLSFCQDQINILWLRRAGDFIM